MFAGQGAQYVGMGRELYDAFPQCRAVFEEADAALGFDLSEMMFAGDEAKLAGTEFTQPAVLTHSLAAFELIKGKITPSYALGLSLGEYTALAAAGALGFADAVALVSKRGKFMAEACPPGTQGMSAVMSLDRELVREACDEASSYGVVRPANFNMPGQIVIAGEIAALEAAEKRCAEKGARKCIRLNVSGAFHTPMLEGAAVRLAAELDGLRGLGKILEPRIPVVSNFTARPVESADDIAPTLLKQIVSPVMWEDSVTYLLERGVDTFIELGPGKALSGFVRKTAGARTVNIYNIEDAVTYYKTLEAIL